MGSIHAATRHTYNQQALFDAYTMWMATHDPADLELAFLEALPLTRRLIARFRYFTKSRLQFTEEDVLSVASLSFYDALLSREMNIVTERDITSRLILKARSAIWQTLIKQKREDWNFELANVPVPISTVHTQKDTELKMFIEQLPAHIREYFNRVNRLQGKDKHVSTVVVELILREHVVRTWFIAQHYQVDMVTAKFIIDYVVVTIRRCLQKVKEGSPTLLDDWHDLFELFGPAVVIEKEYDDDEDSALWFGH